MEYLNGRPIQCHLYDTFGCGKSTHPSTDWEAFSQQEIAKDLQEIFHSIIRNDNNNNNNNNDNTIHTDPPSSPPPPPIFIIGHAHGSSQIIHLINNGLSNQERSYIKGVVFMSGALSDGPVDQISESNCKGGQCIWRLPNFLLDWIQPRLISNDSLFINTSTLGPSAQHLKTVQFLAVRSQITSDGIQCHNGCNTFQDLD